MATMQIGVVFPQTEFGNDPGAVREIYVDAGRHDARLRDLLMQRAELLPQRYRLENDIDGR